MSYATANEKSRRLALLRVLVEMEGSSNESVIRDMLRELGFAGRLLGNTREDIQHLEAAGLVTITYYADKVMVAAIAPRGVAYLAREISPIDGVAYPAIGS